MVKIYDYNLLTFNSNAYIQGFMKFILGVFASCSEKKVFRIDLII